MRDLLKLLLGAALALVTMNIVSFRVYNYEYAYDSILGFVNKPGHTAYSSIEGHGSAHYLEHGIRRQRRWAADAPAPIVVLGDSFTEAHQVGDDVVYTALLEGILAGRGIHNPVLNFADAGYSVADYVVLAPKVREVFHPSWVVVQVREDDFTTDAWHNDKTHFTWETHQRKLEVESLPHIARPSRAMMTRQALKNAIPLIGFARHRISLFAYNFGSEPSLFLANQQVSTLTNSMEKDMGAFPINEEISLLGQAYDFRLTILFIASYDPRKPSAPTPFERKLADLARNIGLGFVSTRSEYPVLAGNRVAPFGFCNSGYNIGHLNVHGHMAAANALAIEILRIKADALF